MQEQNFAGCGCKRFETQLIELIEEQISKILGEVCSKTDHFWTEVPTSSSEDTEATRRDTVRSWSYFSQATELPHVKD